MVTGTGATLFELDDGFQSYFNGVDQTIEPDNHVTLVSQYKVYFFELLFDFWLNERSDTDYGSTGCEEFMRGIQNRCSMRFL